jgi:CS domain.
MSEEINTTNKKITPNILWAQTLEKVYLTIMISESQNNTFQINEGKTIVFKSQSGGQEYEFEFIIDDPVKDYSMNVTSRKVTITFKQN